MLLSIIIILPIFTYQQITAQGDFQAYTVPSTAGDGLSDIRIMDVSGFGSKLWLATDQGGVNTFDGANWETISEMDGLPSNITTAITFDNDGNPWVGFRFGVSTLVNDEWVTYRTADGLANGWITCATRLRDGSLWFGSRDGINIYRDGQWSSPNEEENFVGGYTYNIFEDADSNIWVANREGVNFYDGESWILLDTEDGLSDGTPQDIAQDKDGNIWIATFRNGINIESDTGWMVALESEFIRDLNRGLDGNMYVGTNDGVMKYDYQDFTRFTFVSEDSTDRSGYGNTVNDIIIDGNNNIFAGTWNGLGVVTGQSILHFTSTIGLCSNFIGDLVEDAEGNIWIAGSNRGVSVYTQQNTWENYNLQNTFVGEYVYDLFRDSGDRMWVATSSGAYYFQNGQWKRLTIENGLSHNLVYSLYEDNEGRYWFGSFGGVTMISETDTIAYTPDNGLVSDQINCIMEDSKGNMWFGSGEGLSYFDGIQFSTVMVGSEITSSIINDLLEDSEGNVWVATSQGLSMYDGNAWQIFQSPQISNNSVSCITEVDGEVHVGTFNGLNIYRNGKFEQFHSNDGTLYHNSISEILRASDGTWWVATSSDGLWSTEEIDLTITSAKEIVEQQVKVYPNPVTQLLNIESKLQLQEWTIISYDGKTVDKSQHKNHEAQIPVHHLNSGLYSLQLTLANGEILYTKFIKVP